MTIVPNREYGDGDSFKKAYQGITAWSTPAKNRKIESIKENIYATKPDASSHHNIGLKHIDLNLKHQYLEVQLKGLASLELTKGALPHTKRILGP